MSEKIESQTVTMAHGAGGKQTTELIDKVFAAHFANPDLTADDAAVLTPPVGKMAVSTDGFIVSPAFFPGGNIGKLSICGTVNDLACMGAKPLYLTCAFVIEEGFPMEKLEQIAEAMAKTAKEAGVRIVSGDTKVAGKGQVDGVFITTTGMGQIEDGVQVGGELAKPGDAVIVTGDIGRHGCTILLAREDFGIEADVKCLYNLFCLFCRSNDHHCSFAGKIKWFKSKHSTDSLHLGSYRDFCCINLYSNLALSCNLV